MKSFQIAMFLFIFMNVIAFLQTDIGFVDEPVVSTPLWSQDTTDTFNLSKIEEPEPGIYSFIKEGFAMGGFIFDTLKMFISMLIYSTIKLPLLLDALGVEEGLNAIFTGVAWLIYGAGVVQLISGRIIKTSG